MLAQHVCFSNLPKGLDFLSSMYCDFHEYWKDDGKTWDEKTGEDQLWEYNCKDAVITYEVDDTLAGVVSAFKLTEVNTFQQRLFWPVLKTMNRGIRINTSQRAAFSMELFDAIAQREQWLIDVLGHPVNIKSPKQMQELFYDQFSQKPILGRKSGTVTCDDEALGKIASREPLLRPLVAKIQELRSLSVFLSTFINAPLDIDGRMRCSFNIGGTETYRFSSSSNAFGTGLNLQNIPLGGDTASLQLPNVRKLFIPDEGYTFFDIDLEAAALEWAKSAAGKRFQEPLMWQVYNPAPFPNAKPGEPDPRIQSAVEYANSFNDRVAATCRIGNDQPDRIRTRCCKLVCWIDRSSGCIISEIPKVRYSSRR